MKTNRLLVLALALFTLACRPPQPPRLPIQPIQPLVLPVPAPPTDPTLIGYLKLRDPAATVAGLDDSLVRTMAPEGAASLGLQPGAPAAIFLWEPPIMGLVGGEGLLSTLPLAALFPAPQDSLFMRRLAQLWPALRTTPAESTGPATLVGLNPTALSRAETQGAMLGELLRAPTPFEGFLYLYLEPLVAKYLPTLRASMGALAPMIEQTRKSQSQAGQPNLSGEQVAGMMGVLLDQLATLKSLTLGVTQLPDTIELGTLLEEKRGTSPAGGPIAVPDLARFVPPGAVRLQWNIRDLQRWTDGYLKLYAPLLASQPELKAATESVLADWRRATRSAYLGESMGFDKAHGLRLVGLMQVDNAAQVMALNEQIARRFSSGPIHDAYLKLGIDIRVERTAGVRKIKRWPVDRYVYHVRLLKPPADPISKALLGQFDNMTAETAQVGPFVLFSLGSPGALDQLAESLLRGQGRYPLTARQRFPGGGTLYGDIDTAQLLEGVRSMLPPEQASKLPMLPANLDPVTLFSYDGGDTGYYRLQVPRKLLSQLLGSH